ncbi:MAG TPA: hypothetical protein VGI88_07750 [Verrucomicrobiae bacterium]
MNCITRRAGFVTGLFVLLQAFAVVPAFAALNVTIGQNFLGTAFQTNNQSGIPPDVNGAIGPQHFVELLNGSFAAYDRTDPTIVFRESDVDFWFNAGVSLASDQAITDPRIIYDPLSQRWFASMVDFDANATDPTVEANDFLLAFSATSDPTGDWVGFRFRADTTTNHAFADFPTLGVDSNAVYLSGNMFKGGDNNIGPNLVSIPKADLLNTNIGTRTYFGVLDPAVYGWVLQPATCFDATNSGAILSMGNIGSDSDLHSNIFTFRVLGSSQTNATLSTPVNITVSPYFCPDNPDMGFPIFNPTQPDGTMLLEANDPRFSAKVYNVGGVLYGVHNTEFNSRIAIQWYRVNATNGVLLEQGMISDPNLDLFFPSIAASRAGTVVIGCNGSSINTYVSSFAYVGQTVNGTTTFGSPLLLQSGSVSYHGIDELYLSSDPVPESRWGDYSATSLDPVDPTHFWTIQMFPSDQDPDLDFGIWSTQVTELIAAQPLPQLAIAPAGTNVLISWPSSAAGFQLQSNTNLVSAASWMPVSQTLSTNGNVISVLVPESGSQQFFRLIQ